MAAALLLVAAAALPWGRGGSDAAAGLGGGLEGEAGPGAGPDAATRAPAVPGLDDGEASRVLAAADELDWAVSRREGELAPVASSVLEGLRHGGASLAHAGYLDLLGEVWGCAAVVDGAVELWVVVEDDGACEVRTVRLEAERWEGVCREGEGEP